MTTTNVLGHNTYGGMPMREDLAASCPSSGQPAEPLGNDQPGHIVGCDACTCDIDIVDYATQTGADPESARCPICGALCDTITTNDKGEVLGCDCCMSERDAYDWAVDEHEAYMAWLRETAMGGDYYGE